MMYWMLDLPTNQRGERGVLSIDIVDLFDNMVGWTLLGFVKG